MSSSIKALIYIISFFAVNVLGNQLHAEGEPSAASLVTKDSQGDSIKCDSSQNPQSRFNSRESDLQQCASMKMRALGGLVTIGEAELSLASCYEASNILDPIPKMLSITFARDVSAERLNKMASESMTDNLGEGNSFDSIFECISGVYQDTREGDRYDVLYLPGEGLSLKLNQKLIAHCPDSDWAPKYFNIWFGEKPFHKRLRKELLAQSLSVSGNQDPARPKLPCS